MADKRKGRGMPKSVDQGVRILGTGAGRVAMLQHSQKAGGIMPPESNAERTVIQLADLDPRVRALQGQPMTVDLPTGRIYRNLAELKAGRKLREKPDVKRREYTPDVLLELFDGRKLIIEVKDERFLGDDDYREKLCQAESLFRRHGYEFLIITLRYDLTNPLIQNAALLTSFRACYRGELSDAQRARAEEVVAHGNQPLGAVCTALNISLREAPLLFLSALLATDLKASRISASSPVNLAQGDLSHLELLPLESK